MGVKKKLHWMDPEQVGTATGGSNIRVADVENW